MYKRKIRVLHWAIIATVIAVMAVDSVQILTTSPIQFHVGSGDIDQVSRFINEGGDISAQTAQGDNLLCIAVTNDAVPMVRFLIDNGANPNGYDSGLNTPLYIAVDKSKIHLVKVLLEAGASPSKSYIDREATPFNLALARENIDVVKTFLDHGVVVTKAQLEKVNDPSLKQFMQSYTNSSEEGSDTIMSASGYRSD